MPHVPVQADDAGARPEFRGEYYRRGGWVDRRRGVGGREWEVVVQGLAARGAEGVGAVGEEGEGAVAVG